MCQGATNAGGRVRTIDAVLFDAIGTLFHARGSIGDIYRRVALGFGADVPAGVLDAAFERETARRGMPLHRLEWKALVEAVFRAVEPFPRFDAFFDEVYDAFQSGQSWVLFPETRTVLATLGAAGLKLAVVSNFDRRLERVLGDLEIDGYFDAVVTPDSAGRAKPDPGIFLDATARLGVAPERTLFVGDDPTIDIDAALRAGLRAKLVDRHRHRLREDAVADLEGILPLLGIR